MTWNNYYNVHKNSETSKVLSEAEKYIKLENGKALDIGSGTGRDIPFLLSKGFKVTAIDSDEKSITIIKNKFEGEPNLKIIQSTYENFNFEINTYDFINAQFALFFVPKDKIIPLLEKVKNSLKKGGIFCGQILGPQDTWAKAPNMNFLEESEIEEVFKDFKFHILKEIKRNGKTASGVEKFWHYFNVIVEK